jgi:hypothetical protein
MTPKPAPMATAALKYSNRRYSLRNTYPERVWEIPNPFGGSLHRT